MLCETKNRVGDRDLSTLARVTKIFNDKSHLVKKPNNKK